MKKERGFTLIELLAVIVILGILMAVAIPAMTKYIENSKKDAFWQTGKTYINAARYGLLNDEYFADSNSTSICGFPPSKKTDGTELGTVVPTNIIELEKGSRKSAWNKELSVSYVICVNEGATEDKPKYVYYYAGNDENSNGTDFAVKEDVLSRAYVSRGLSKLGNAKPTKGGTVQVHNGSEARTVEVYAVCDH